ncbi:S1C family serine protease [Capsulimonas corticalis]|nr:S1C family serine protease [Capsulimonas corticalis]
MPARSLNQIAVLASLLSACVAGAAHAGAPPTPPAAASARTPLTIREVADLALPSIVMIVITDKLGTNTALGSGFVLAPGVVATNIHVIADAATVTVHFADGRSATSPGAVAVDRDHDLILIRVDTGAVRPLRLASEQDYHVGDTVVALGNPEGLGWSVSAGLISALREENNLRVVQTTAPISHGSSGGPLLDLYGNVVGVNSFNWGEGQNLNFAYPGSYLDSLLQHPSKRLSPWRDFKSPPPATPPASETPPPAAPAPAVPPAQPDPPAPAGGLQAMVWVNLTTHVYHRPGSRYYGKTKKGRYMTEADAIAHGCHASGNGQ